MPSPSPAYPARMTDAGLIAPRRPWTIGAILVVLGGAMFVVSMAPGLFPGASPLNYSWRLGLIALLLGAVADAHGFYFDRKTLSVLGAWCAMLLVHSVIFAFEGETVLLAARSLILMVFVSALVGSSSRVRPGPDLVRIFFWTVFLGTLVLTLLTIVQVMGEGWTWEAGRLAKARLQLDGEFSANSAIFILILSVFFLLSESPRLVLLSLGAIAVASVFLATRTPIIAAILALTLVALWTRVTRRISPRKWSAVAKFIAFFFLAGLFGFALYMAKFENLSIVWALAGRTNLWAAALDRWSLAPLFGSGPVSVAEAVAYSYFDLNFAASWQVESLLNLTGGGFHSVWFQTLALQGLIGIALLAWSFFRLIVPALSTTGTTCYAVIIIYITLRSHFEYSGLFSNPNGPLDFLATLAVFHSAAMARREAGRDAAL